MLFNVQAGRFNTFCQARDRDTGVSDDRIRRRSQTASRPIGIVPRLPQAIAILFFVGPLEFRAATIIGNFAKQCALFRCRCLRTVKLDKHRWHFFKIKL